VLGPEVISFREIIERLLTLINKKRLLLPMPLQLATITAKIFQLLPNPILTEDQLRLLKYDNVLSGKYKSNSDIGVPSKKYFNEEVKNILICGERVDNSLQKNIQPKRIFELI
jgi:hypothetical protein